MQPHGLLTQCLFYCRDRRARLNLKSKRSSQLSRNLLTSRQLLGLAHGATLKSVKMSEFMAAIRYTAMLSGRRRHITILRLNSGQMLRIEHRHLPSVRMDLQRGHRCKTELTILSTTQESCNRELGYQVA